LTIDGLPLREADVRSALLIRLWGIRLKAANWLSRAFHWATSEGRPAAGGLILLALTLVVSQFTTLPHVWLVPILLLVLLAIAWALKARLSIVIEDFADHTPGTNAAKGAAKLLSVELAKMGDVFRVVDERNALPTAVGEGIPLEAAIRVDSLSEIIRNSVTADTKISFAGVEIPVGTGMMLIGRIVQGPRLRCQLHEIGGRLILSAQISGLRHSPSWRLEQEIDPALPESRDSATHEMIPNLAIRMFTSLGLKRKVKWRAMRSFLKGLETYRSCLRTPRDRSVKLLAARRSLSEALAEDEDFVLVYYNLGVVYNELSRIATRAGRDEVAARHRDAAEASFERAVQQDPARWEPYYALARLHYERGEMEQARELCERVIELPRGARLEKVKARDLIGLTYERPSAEGLASARKASKGVLRALRDATLKRRTVGTEEDQLPTVSDLAANCLANLAEEEASRSPALGAPGSGLGWFSKSERRFRRILRLYRLAHSLTDKDAILHFNLGLVAGAWGKHDLAIEELRAATRIEPERGRFWAALGYAYARRGDAGDADNAAAATRRARAVIDMLRATEDEQIAIDVASATYRTLGKEGPRQSLAERTKFREEFKSFEQALNARKRRRKRAACSEIDAAISDHLQNKRNWEAGQLSVLLGRHYVTDEYDGFYPEKAERRLQAAIELLKKDPRDLARADVYAYLARALVRQGRKDEALKAAEQAVSLAPLSSVAHDQLGQIFDNLGDLEAARLAWTDALLWNPSDPDLHWELGFCNWRLAQEATDRDKRQHALAEAERYLTGANILVANERFGVRVRIHYWLARLYEELGQFDDVIPNLRMVQTSDGMNTVADLLVARAYRRGGNFNAAQTLFERVIEEVDSKVQTDGRPRVVGVAEVYEAWPLTLVRAEARCGLAMAHVERGGDPHAAEAALEPVRTELKTGDFSTYESQYPERLHELSAHYHHAEGLIHLQQDDPEGAIDELNKSITFQSDADVYLALANAYLAKANEAADSKRRVWLSRSHSYVSLVLATDARGLCTKALEDLAIQLDAASDTAKARPRARIPAHV
jgi:tetratricopeptide (TPR) repeat protein